MAIPSTRASSTGLESDPRSTINSSRPKRFLETAPPSSLALLSVSFSDPTPMSAKIAPFGAATLETFSSFAEAPRLPKSCFASVLTSTEHFVSWIPLDSS